MRYKIICRRFSGQNHIAFLYQLCYNKLESDTVHREYDYGKRKSICNREKAFIGDAL